MDTGHFYFIKDQYFIDFPDSQLMQNKETVNGQPQAAHAFMRSKMRLPGFFG